jgi:hypothetical protein
MIGKKHLRIHFRTRTNQNRNCNPPGLHPNKKSPQIRAENGEVLRFGPKEFALSFRRKELSET